MEEKQKKCGFAVIIGRPNVGKSTLMNHLIGQKIAITSNKPQTTRNRIRTVYTDDRGQVIFLDTPGIHKAKNKLGEYMMTAADTSIASADVIVWMVEASPVIGPGDRRIAERLAASKVPVILVINKIDTFGKEKASQAEKEFAQLLDFSEIICTSALRSNGTDEVLKAIFKALPCGPQLYDEETVTEIPLREIVAEIIREKALRCLNDEIPHGIAVEIDSMKERPGIFDVDAVIVCEKESHKGIIIGKGGQMLKKIGSLARADAEDVCGAKVNLKLWVKVRREWRDDRGMMKSFGYDIKDLK